MADQVLLAANRGDVKECVELACEYGLGIEIIAFALPNVLDGMWLDLVETYRSILEYVPGMLSIHGPFMDMVSGSPDEHINQVCRERYQHAIRIASRLKAERVVFHANFIGLIHNPEYRIGWHERNVHFWGPLADYAEEHGVTIVLENMWEFDPTIIGDLLAAVNHPNLRSCLDVGHAHLFSDKTFTLDDWLETLEPWLVHTHMNNNNGIIDEHHGFDWEDGVLDYGKILPKLRALKNPPAMVLEMHNVEDMRSSLLRYMEIAEKYKTPT